MIKATHEDFAEIINFLNLRKYENSLIIGDIEQYGFDKPDVQTFIHKENEQIKYLILIFGRTLLYFDPYHLINEAIVNELVNKFAIKNILIGEDEIEHLQQFYNDENKFLIHKQFLATYYQLKDVDTSIVQDASREDIYSIIESRHQTPETAETSSGFDVDLKNEYKAFDQGISQNVVIKNAENKVVSGARILMSTRDISIIGGVFTHPQYRNLGYGTLVTAAITKKILKNKKTPVLFFHNEVAGRIYLNLGYKVDGKLNTIIVKK